MLPLPSLLVVALAAALTAFASPAAEDLGAAKGASVASEDRPQTGLSPITDAAFSKTQTDIRELQSGRPTITGQPRYANGVKCTNTTGSCLNFQDGTTQNTAPANLAGNNQLATTSTFTIAGYNNLEIMISSGDFSLVTAATIPVVSSYYGTTSSGTYRLELNYFVAGTATTVYLLVAGDNGTNYAYAYSGNNAGGGSPVSNSTSARLIPLMGIASDTMQNTFGNIQCRFGSTYSVKNARFDCWGDYGTNTITRYTVSAKYTGAQSVSSLTLTTNATSNISGHWEVWEGQHWQP